MNIVLRSNFYKRILFLFIIVISTLPISMVSANPVIKAIDEVEQRLGARVGVSVYDRTSRSTWSSNGDSRFPLMSTFKTLACAKLLADADKGDQSLDTMVAIKKYPVVTWSPVIKKYAGEEISLKHSCSATLTMSDNTAANIVLDAIGGPEALTQFLRSIGDEVTRLDRIEPYLGEATEGDVRDTTTPDAMVKNLRAILLDGVLSEPSTEQLKQWMMANKVSDSLLRSVLPSGWLIADRSGAGGNGSRGIIAVVWSDQRAPLVIAIYLTQTDASFKERNKAIAEIGRAIFSAYQ